MRIAIFSARQHNPRRVYDSVFSVLVFDGCLIRGLFHMYLMGVWQERDRDIAAGSLTSGFFLPAIFS